MFSLNHGGILVAMSTAMDDPDVLTEKKVVFSYITLQFLSDSWRIHLQFIPSWENMVKSMHPMDMYFT